MDNDPATQLALARQCLDAIRTINESPLLPACKQLEIRRALADYERVTDALGTLHGQAAQSSMEAVLEFRFGPRTLCLSFAMGQYHRSALGMDRLPGRWIAGAVDRGNIESLWLWLYEGVPVPAHHEYRYDRDR